MERRTKVATQTGIYLLLVLAIVVVANVFSYKYYARVDMTKQERFTISKGSKRMVCEGLSKELTVDFYVTRGLAKTDLFIEDVTRLFEEYQNAKYEKPDGSPSPPSKFRFNVIEPKTDDEKKEAKDAGLQEQLLGEGSETSAQATIASGFLGFVIKYGSEKVVIPSWPPNGGQGLEFFISNKIREVRDKDEKRESRYGVITGKDEIKLSDNFVPAGAQPASLKNIFDHYFPFYKFVDVDLKNGDEEIDKGLLGLIITQPKKDYTEKELRRIDEFLMSGNKALVFYVSAVNVNANDKDMKATLNTHGLEKLLDGYGVEMKREAAIDFGSAFQQGAQGQMGDEIWFVNPAIPLLAYEDGTEEKEPPDASQTGQLIDQRFPAFFRLPQISFPFPSPLVIHQEKQQEAKMHVVARTSPLTSVYASDNMVLSHNADWQETEPQEQKIVGVAIDGTIKSAYAGKGDNMGIAAAEKSETSRVLILSSSQFLTNPFARAGNPPPLPPQLQMMGGQQGDPELMFMAKAFFSADLHLLMVTSFKGTLDWMANDADLVAINAKLLSEPTLTYSKNKPRKPLVKRGDTEEVVKLKQEEFRKAQEQNRDERAALQSRIKWWLTILPAALLAAFGIIRWRLREANRDKVAL